MELDKYDYSGWTLGRDQIRDLYNLIKEHKKNNLRVLEFGSGLSTEFLVDVVLNGVKNLEITSFDNREEFSFKNKNNYPFLSVKIRDLFECDDKSYSDMFITKKINNERFKIKKSPLSIRQKNCFYEIRKDDINGVYDLMILDGPNGNGRNISFLHTKDNLEKGTIVLIDDFNHYDFLEKFSLFYEYTEIKRVIKNVKPKKNYVLLKIMNKK